MRGLIKKVFINIDTVLFITFPANMAMKSVVIFSAFCFILAAYSLPVENENNSVIDVENQILKPTEEDSVDNDKIISDAELISTAESNNNYVYRPLYVYRRIEHSKRRITMYNSFAG